MTKQESTVTQAMKKLPEDCFVSEIWYRVNWWTVTSVSEQSVVSIPLLLLLLLLLLEAWFSLMMVKFLL
jgi:hypothetical protein